MAQIPSEIKDKKILPLSFQKAVYGFLGYLKGTSKAAHTIKSYRLDLDSFASYIHKQVEKPHLSLKDLDILLVHGYKQYLEGEQRQPNTRRRQLLTVHLFLNYWVKRKKLSETLAVPILVPHKIERIPAVLNYLILYQSIQNLKTATILQTRNKLLVWFLLETACFVSEISGVKITDFKEETLTTCITFDNKKGTRTLTITRQLYEAIMTYNAHRHLQTPLLFESLHMDTGKNEGMSSRNIEIIVKGLCLSLGFHQLTPRVIRNTTILHWLEKGESFDTIQKKLGLKTKYAFKAYLPFLTPKKK